MVEHLLAACHGLGITDLSIDVSGSEMPIFDGSSAMYVSALKEAGLKKSQQETSWIVVKRPLSVSKDHGSIHIVPGDPVIDVTAHLHEKVHQQFTFHRLQDSFDVTLSQARTFARLADVERMQKQGYIRGGSLSTAVVLHEGTPINQGGFRMSNECARHKVLDLIGDLALLGHFLHASVYAINPSHTLNHQAVLSLASSPDSFEIVSFSQLPPSMVARAVLP
jgi:UDP-3-O-[3-hydroxymyristoyl] N-acetylglucosamine deacetylase